VAQSPEEKLIWSTTEEGDLYFLSEDEGQKNAADLCHLGPWTRFEGLFFVAHSSSEWVGDKILDSQFSLYLCAEFAHCAAKNHIVQPHEVTQISKLLPAKESICNVSTVANFAQNV
jgi:hypothetical protein